MIWKKTIIIGIYIIFFSSVLFGQEWKIALDKTDQYIDQQNYSAALTFAESALKLAGKELGKKHPNYAIILGRIGQIYFYMGDYNKAIDYFIQEKDLKKEVLGPNHPSYAAALHNLTTVYQKLSRYREAEPLLLEALRIKKETVGENDSSYAMSLHNLALNYQETGNYAEAEKNYLKAIEIKKNVLGESNESYANSIISLGSLYQKLGNYEKALSLTKKAADIYVKVLGDDNPQTVQAESKLASLYMETGNHDKAEEILKRNENFQKNILGKDHPDYAQTLYNLGVLSWETKDYDKAEQYFQKSKEIVEKRLGNTNQLYSSCLNALGVLNWRSGNLEKAYQYFSEATYLKEQLFGENHPDFAMMLHNLAGVLKDMKQYKLAEENYKRAFDLYAKQLKDYFPFLSDNEKAKYYARMKVKFELFDNYVLQRGRDNPKLIEYMYNYNLITKAILLNSSKKVRRIILESNDKGLIDKYRKWIGIKEDLSVLYEMPVFGRKQKGQNIDSLENLANTLEKEISLKSHEFEKEYDKKSVTWKDIRNVLDKNEAAVELIRFRFFNSGEWSDTVFYAALIVKHDTKDHPDMVIINNGKELEDLYIKYYKKSIRHKLKDIYSYKEFWEKIDEKLDGVKTVYLSQDGIYNVLNPETLQKPDGSYVIDDKNIVVVTNTRDLLNKHKEKKDDNKIACLFGSPDFTKIINPGDRPPKNAQEIPDLPGTKSEIDKIKGYLLNSKWKTEIFLGDNASEQNFKNIKNVGLLHLATHGFFDKNTGDDYHKSLFGVDFNKAVNNPLLRSGLLLTGSANYLGKNGIESSSTGNNGILTAYEAMNLNLEGTKLVVLSACETGLGEIQNGEGVYGLQRAFLIAGVDAVIMSLWKVDDLATQELMADFYRNWLESGDLKDAFKKAQMMIKNKYKYPYFWGSFVLVEGLK